MTTSSDHEGAETAGEQERRASDLADVEILADRAAELGPDDGFLKLQRLTVRNRYKDGSASEEYPCDVVSRENVDAVTIVLFEQQGEKVLVGLRENLRVPIWLRRHKDNIPFADAVQLDTMLETVAGVIEPQDVEGTKEQALRMRAVHEAKEEVGIDVDPAEVLDLGGASFPSPGITDEKVYFRAAEVSFAEASTARGDGSTMEEVGGLVILPLEEAIRRTRDGRIADMKTEIALLRLRDRLSRGLA